MGDYTGHLNTGGGTRCIEDYGGISPIDTATVRSIDTII
jgi:hypothetical protein